MASSERSMLRSVLAHPLRAFAFTLALCFALPPCAHAQSALDVQFGKWAVDGGDPTYYSAALWRDLWGPFGYNLRGLAIIHRDSLDRSIYGFIPELTLLRGDWPDARLALYGVGGAGLGLETGGSTELTALWSAGLGVELRAPTLFSANLEARRFAEDPGFRGFWDLATEDRRGWLVSIGFSIRWGGARRYRAEPPARVGSAPLAAPVDLPGSPAAGPAANAEPGTPVEAAPLANAVVETALSAMGEPYRWGGTSADEGFDCSGLVWYAYAQHGINIPRISRDQARAGSSVPADVGALAPGDILIFSARRGVVTHVGLYIGGARFIHATTSGGVRVGYLDDAADATDQWYLSRWVGARRVLQ